MTDDERETQFREEIGAPKQNNSAWRPNQFHASDMAFLLRRLNEARAEIAKHKELNTDLAIELQEAVLENNRLRAPPGADAIDRAERLVSTGTLAGNSVNVARAIEQAALAAREQALEEADAVIPENYQFSSYPDLQRMAQNAVATYRGYIRALGQRKPG